MKVLVLSELCLITYVKYQIESHLHMLIAFRICHQAFGKYLEEGKV